ncbi:sigma 54-interacting transcriptional regulator [Thermoactinomyces mirandus]|uniref:Sigma 54-interacting transcriptional regulator n=1 Tax=Thermoactinomyces mirandus TaxID=2756294 RepID=A0A7W1XU47_9BACL|nr:sigma-54-dependent transcriptional regulator [Thermoactinomyces mirandus]MBA4603238.1 sigma 54-interacting transcriptional regulator [Thermoactinomyces mirandus]
MSKIDDIFHALIKLNQQDVPEGIDASQISRKLGIDRSTASRYLNELVRQDKVVKVPGKPVKYRAKPSASPAASRFMPKTHGVGKSLEPILEQAMAAFLYPTKSLPILLTGETGTGKTYLAETLSKLAKKQMVPTRDFPFIVFNCADYAQNAELLVGQIFGIKEGAFTGAIRDQEGLVEQADGGILFLDEIHRLPPSGQEMLFYLMDKGVYRRLGEAIRTRHANVTLIGATTEDPGKVLLPTLYRRFSVKLNLPPLRERTREERKVLINHFLAEEAGKMGQALAITDNCREALLSYPCPGNIGQLKSDIQIACAHAYLRYLKSNREKVLITAEDLPEEVYVYATRSNLKQIRTIDGSGNWPETGQDDFSLPNIYRHLANQSDHKSLQDVIKTYIRELSRRYHQPHVSKQGWQQLIDKDLFQALTRARHELKDVFPVEPDINQLYVIGLHLQNFRNHQKQQTNKESLPIVIHPNVAYRRASRHLARYLDKEIGLKLPDEEVELIAHFLPDRPTEVYTASGQSVAIILVTHGDAAASSMADVTNTLLGNKVIHAIDMPLNLSASSIYERVKEKIKSLEQVSGVLLLVDIGSLITMGDTIRHDVDIPVKTLSCVNLPMVLEAGRKSLVTDLTLDDIYDAAKKAMTTFFRENEAEKNIKKKRMIATVCFTGEGAAQLLESWLKDQLSAWDQDVIIRTVRIDPTTKDTSVLNDLKNYYDMIAIIGTVPVSIKGIPYIPAWELLQQDGISRMTKLLEVTRKTPVFPEKSEVAAEEIYSLAVQGLGEIVTHVNPKTVAAILDRHLPPIRDFYSWDTDRELGMWMHLGSLMDRIVAAQLKNDSHKLTAAIPLDGKIVITDQEKEVWKPLLTALENTFSVTISDSVEKELIKLSR